MADLFEVAQGVSITDNNDVELINILGAEGPPGSLTIEDDAPRSSFAADILSGDFYTKRTSGPGVDKWTRLATVDDLTASTNSIHWREPVKATDDTVFADITAAEAALNANPGFDDVTLSDGDRVLIPNLTAGQEDVYIVSGTPGAGATLVLDSHGLHDGDTLYIQEGTMHGDHTENYNGTDWVQTGSGSSAELEFLRAFMGKSASGNVLPDYTSNNYILDDDQLTAALSKLDVQVGTNAGNVTALTTLTSNLQAEVDAIEASLGGAFDTDGTFVGFTGTNLLDSATSITDALTALDTAVGGNQDDADIRAFIGKAAAGPEDTGFSSTNIVVNAESLEAAIGRLDTFIDRERHEVNIPSNLGQNVVDSVLVDDVKAVLWHVEAQEIGSQNTRVVLVHGSHNGNGSNDADDQDRSEFARLRMGNVGGFRTRVTLSGAGASQVMQLEVRTNNASVITVTRKILA